MRNFPGFQIIRPKAVGTGKYRLLGKIRFPENTPDPSDGAGIIRKVYSGHPGRLGASAGRNDDNISGLKFTSLPEISIGAIAPGKANFNKIGLSEKHRKHLFRTAKGRIRNEIIIRKEVYDYQDCKEELLSTTMEFSVLPERVTRLGHLQQADVRKQFRPAGIARHDTGISD